MADPAAKAKYAEISEEHLGKALEPKDARQLDLG